MKKQFFFGIIVLLLPLSLCGGTGALQHQIENLINRQKYNYTDVGVYICSSDSVGFDSVAINSDTFFIPASVAKLATGAAALELLGANFTFKTRIYTESELDTESGILHGNLYIVGGGDPGFLAERLWLFVQHLYHRGLRKIDGDLILDDSFFDSEKPVPGFSEDKTSRAYMAPAGALSASFNSIAVHQRPGEKAGQPIHVDVFPHVFGMKIESAAKTALPGKATGVTVRTEKMDDRTCLYVYGTMAVDDAPRYTYRKIWHAGRHFGRVLRSMFEDNGIKIRGTQRIERVPDALLAREAFYTFESQPLMEFIRHMFKYSSNFAAEMVYQTISARQDSIASGNWKDSQRILRSWWHSSNLVGRLNLVNGSGMGAENRLTPRQVVSLLEYVQSKKEYFPDYCAALSVAGIDGTLEDRFIKSPLKGKVRAKTGTLNSSGVSSLAGYLLLPKVLLEFAILVNSKERTQFEHWVLQQRILEVAAQWVADNYSKDKPAGNRKFTE